MTDAPRTSPSRLYIIGAISGFALLLGIFALCIYARNGEQQRALRRTLSEATYNWSWEEVLKIAKAHPELLAVRNRDGATPLHFAAYHDDCDTAALLIAKGADVNAEDNDGLTPLAVALKKGSTAVAELLRAHGGKE